MAAIPTYESKVTLQANNGGGEVSPINTSKYFPSTAPDLSKAAVALMGAQKKMDKARALEYKNAMLQYVSENTYGEKGYLKQLGKNALEADELGNGLAQRGIDGYDKFSEDWFKNNNFTPEQMRIAKEETFGVRLGYQQGMSAHVLQEGKRYQVEQCETAITNAINDGLLATTPEAVGAAVGRLKEARATSNEILGLDGETAKAKGQEDSSKFWRAMFTKQLLSTDKDPIGGYNRAKAILDSHYKEMDAVSILDCRAKLRMAEENKALAQVLNGHQGLADIGNVPGANALSLFSTNGKRTPEGVVHYFMTKDNRQSGDKNVVARYSNGGYGVSGVRMEDMLKVVRANKELNPENLSDEELKQKFIENRTFNYEVGIRYANMLAQQYGDDTKMIVAYQLGEEKVDEAVNLAAADGRPDKWLGYVKGDISNVRKVLEGIRDYQEGNIRGTDGKLLDPCSADFIKNMHPQPTDEDLLGEISALDGGYTANNPIAKQRFLGTLRAKANQELVDKERQYRQNFSKCVQAIQNGQEVPAETLNALPISAQRWMQKFQDKRNMNDGTPDYAAYVKYKSDPMLLARMSDEDFNTFVAPLMGNKLSEITLLRNANREAIGLSVDQAYANRLGANKGQVNWAFAPAADELKGAITRVFGVKADNSAHFNGLYWRLQTAVAYEAQRRSQYSSTGKEASLKGAELEHFLLKYKGDCNREGIVPMQIPIDSLPDATEKDALSLAQMLADRQMLAQSGRNVPGTKDQMNMCWGAVCSGEIPENVNISIAELQSDFRISQSVLSEARDQLTGEGKPVTVRGLLNRYALILCGWTPTGRGRPYVGPTAVPTTDSIIAELGVEDLDELDN